MSPLTLSQETTWPSQSPQEPQSYSVRMARTSMTTGSLSDTQSEALSSTSIPAQVNTQSCGNYQRTRTPLTETFQVNTTVDTSRKHRRTYVYSTWLRSPIHRYGLGHHLSCPSDLRHIHCRSAWRHAQRDRQTLYRPRIKH